MLIRINDSIVEALRSHNGIQLQNTLLALENLASACREGKHMVTANRRTLETIKEFESISLISRSIYSRLWERFSQLENLVQIVNMYAELTCDQQEYSIEAMSGKTIIKLPPKFFKDTKSIQETILLCENLRDTEWYKIFAKVMLVWLNVRGVDITFEPRGGGGCDTKSEYDRLQSECDRFCLTILDGDLSCPSGSIGNTASSVRSCHNNTCCRINYLILKAREIENLLPKRTLEEITDGNPQRLRALELFELFRTSSSPESRLFLDLKEGLPLGKVFDDCSSSYWKSLSLSIKIQEINVDCLTDWECDNLAICNCSIPSGFGDRLLDNSIEWLERKDPFQISKIVDSEIRLEWERIGQKIIDWCLAGSPIRTY